MSDIYAPIDDEPPFSQEDLDELKDDPKANDDDAPQANYETADEFIRWEVIPNLPPSDDDDDEETMRAAIQVTVYVIVEGLKSAAAAPGRKGTTQVEGITPGDTPFKYKPPCRNPEGCESSDAQEKTIVENWTTENDDFVSLVLSLQRSALAL
ncbi:hypothetical protein NLJ89_g7036 [Agrocybe chaxingu]|uniref:Uncharacterized protein n=1 Tax=Agrocybe chaxingu TaxID=84603 RepID=A0A9W8JVA2_9AGAR|nr:hypothetical protein NLJ89_g7036 [Agrocybe chaxingu]